MTCKRCGEKGEMTCPFQSSEIFGANWNCGHINKIRDLCDEAINGTDRQLHYQYCEDQKYAVITIDDIGDEDDEDTYIGLCLWVSWYKSRGATDAMWILNSFEPPRKPTFNDLERIIKYYERRK